jgi:diacylglycerol O-acyltransferase
MRQLSGLDHAFLQLERGNNYMHVAGLGLYDPSTAPGGLVRFKDILRFFAARIERFPHFRRRLLTVPWMLDRPWWVEDADLDVEFHVRHIALPQPGDWRQLCIQVARLHSRPLDRSKPLWEAYVIEGLHNVPGVPSGSFALYTKVHHALIDGEAGSELTRALHSLSPDDVESEDGTVLTVRVADREPSAIEIYSRALASNLQKLPKLARFSLDAATRVAGLGAGLVGRIAFDRERLKSALAAVASGDLTSALPRLPPVTRFSGPVSAHRVFEAVGVPLAELKDIPRKVGDATINDLFLTIVGGALNRYLGSRGELPSASMIAGVPSHRHDPDAGAFRDRRSARAAGRDPRRCCHRKTGQRRAGQGSRDERARAPADAAGRCPAAQRAPAEALPHRLERPRSGRSALHGRCAAGGACADQHRGRRNRAQLHRF